MAWITLGVVVALAVYVHRRFRAVAKELRRMSLVHHEAANRAMRRFGRDKWRFRQIDGVLRDIALTVDPFLDIPDLERGPPDDPDSA